MRHLVLFAKAPRAGLVKTRLAQSIGEAAALAAYQTLVQYVLDAMTGFREVTIQFAPDDAHPHIAPWLKPGWTASSQGSGDLSTRLIRCFEEQFQSGATRVVIIGSDCPYLQASDIETAWKSLETQDVVLGPAVDGGYWLIGLSKPCPLLFLGVDWSTDKVLQQTLERADQASLSTALLRPLPDVDTIEDWNAFAQNQVLSR